MNIKQIVSYLPLSRRLCDENKTLETFWKTIILEIEEHVSLLYNIIAGITVESYHFILNQ